MSDLPIGWTLSTLEELAVNPTADIVDGPFGSNLKASEYQEDGIPIIRLQNVKRSRFIDKNIKYVSNEKAKELQRHSFVAGDLVITKLGDPLGEAAIVPEKFGNGIIVADIVRARLDTKLADKKYVMYAINSPEIIRSLETEVKGTTRPRVNLGHIRRLEIPLAPLNEQKRIVEKLNSLLARVDACQTHLERVRRILKRFRQSMLAAATSGRLTEDWRSERAFDGEWGMTDIQSVALVGTGSTPLRSKSNFYSSNGTPWVTSAATGQTFINSAKEFVTKEAIKAHRLKLFPIGTVIVAMYGEGKTRGQVSELAIEATINQACAAIVVDDTKVAKKYLKLALQANYLEMREMAEGGSQPNLNLSKIKEFTFPLPSPDEQAEIVRRVERLFAYAERIETRYTSALKHVERLTPSLLAKAFHGELVEQDPSDESAEVLLEKIAVNKKILVDKPKLPVKSKEPRMYKMEETLEEIIQELPKDTFSFEDLRQKFSGDYETLKEQLFMLLNDENRIIEQVFDKSAEAMRFVRRKK